MANSASSVDLPNANIALRSISRHFIVALQCFDVVYRHRLLMSPCDSSVSASHFCLFFLLPPHFFPFKNKGFEQSRQIPPPQPRVTPAPFPTGGTFLAVRGCPLPWRPQIYFPARRQQRGRPCAWPPAGRSPVPHGHLASRWRVQLSPHPSPQRGRHRAALTTQRSGAARWRHASPCGEPPCGTCLTRCLGPLASHRRLEPSRPWAAAGSGPAFCCQGLAWVQAALQRDPAGIRLLWSRSHRAGGGGRSPSAIPAGTRRARQKQSPCRALSSAGTRGALRTSPLGTTGSRERQFTFGVVCRVSSLIRVGIFGMEKTGSGGRDCPARQSPAVNAADPTQACVFSGRLMGSVSLGSTSQTHSHILPPI